MNDLAPLLLLWLASQGRGRAASSRPPWPNAISPPPPPPLPLAPLPPMPPSDVPEAVKAAVQARNDMYKAVAKRGVAQSVRDVVKAENPKKLKPIVVTAKPSTPAFLQYNPESDVAVSSLQTIINRLGGKVARDGVYGPITAAAWSALAKKRGLQPNIARVSTKIARVATQTFGTLQDAVMVP